MADIESMDPFSYRWTKRDQAQTQLYYQVPNRPDPEGGPAAQTAFDTYGVSPYGVLPNKISGAQGTKPGDMVIIEPKTDCKLERWRVQRFDYARNLVWLPPPPEVASCATLGEVCGVLLKLSALPDYKARYENLYKDFAGGKKVFFTKLLFDYWGNTDYRYESSNSSGFSWTTADKDPMSLPAKGLRVVPTHKVEEVKVHVVSGSQAVCGMDPDLEKIKIHIHDLEKWTARVRELLKKSEDILRERMSFVHNIHAVQVLLEASARNDADPEAAAKAAELAAKAKALATTADSAARTIKMVELLKAGQISREFANMIRRTVFGFVDDIAAEIKKVVGQIRHKLLNDDACHQDCRSWILYVFKNSLFGSLNVLDATSSLDRAVSDALEVMVDGDCGTADISGDGDKIWEIIKKLPDKLPDSAVDFPQTDSFIHAAAMFVRRPYQVMQIGLAAAGNVLGPPTLRVAMVQFRALSQFRNLFASASLPGAGIVAKEKLESFLLEVRGSYSKVANLEGKQEVMKALDEAIIKRNPADVARSANDFGTERGDATHSRPVAKIAVFAIQAICIVVSAVTWYDDAQKPNVDRQTLMVDGFNTIGGAVVFGASVGVEIAKALHHVYEGAKAVSAVLEPLGLLTLSLFNFISFGISFASFIDKWNRRGQETDWAIAMQGASALGSLVMTLYPFVMIAGSLYPPIAIFGGALIVASAFYNGITVAQEKARSPVNRLAEMLLSRAMKKPFGKILLERDDFKKDFDALLADVVSRDVKLPLIVNHINEGRALREAGFSETNIRAVVDTSKPALPGLSAVPSVGPVP